MVVEDEDTGHLPVRRALHILHRVTINRRLLPRLHLHISKINYIVRLNNPRPLRLPLLPLLMHRGLGWVGDILQLKDRDRNALVWADARVLGVSVAQEAWVA